VSAAPAIRVDRLTKAYGRGKRPALAEVTLEIEPGEILGLIGPNGAGKTTFLGCLLGLLTPTAGTITIEGRPPDDLGVRRASGYLPERLQFDRWRTGWSFLAFHHALAGLPAAGRATDVQAALERVALEPGRWMTAIKRYSRGMLQRLGMAQALLGEPRFVFLDEPASGVDPAGVLAFREILLSLKARGTTVILNSHQLDQLERVCDRVAYIEAGSIKHIENLRVAESGRRVLVVRWLAGEGVSASGTPATPAAEAIAGAARGAEVEAVEIAAEAGRGRFAVAGDAQAAALLRALAGVGCAVVEAAPEAGRLEKLFRPDAGGAAVAGKEPS
jgi:ABC-2 type transport system ATP-binding protein